MFKELIDMLNSRGFGPVVVFYPPERMKWDLGKEMIVYISGPDITKSGEARDLLATAIGEKVRDAFLPEKIECSVLDEPKQGEGRWSWSKP